MNCRSVQPVPTLTYPNFCNIHELPQVAKSRISMLPIACVRMLHLTNLGKCSRKRWCTAIVLVAVCTLTISVATRYSSSQGPIDQTLTAVQKHHCLRPGLQRLLNNAATWMPPVVEAAIFHDPGHYRSIVPSDPPISSVLLERNLYNRPPPSLFPLS